MHIAPTPSPDVDMVDEERRVAGAGAPVTGQASNAISTSEPPTTQVNLDALISEHADPAPSIPSDPMEGVSEASGIQGGSSRIHNPFPIEPHEILGIV